MEQEPANIEIRIRLMKKMLDDKPRKGGSQDDSDEDTLDLGKVYTEFMRL